MEKCRSQGREAARARACRPVSRNGRAEVGGRRAHRPPAPDAGERAARTPAEDQGDFVFPTDKGNAQRYANILHRGFEPAQIAAKVVDDEGKPKYALHSLRHFYASWCINRGKDGGLELPLTMVQERMGHSSITITANRYGHLFPSADDGAELKEAEKKLWPT